MAGYRFWLQCSLSMVVALAVVQIGRSQWTPYYDSPDTASIDAKKSNSCKVYSLAELGDDPKLCKWIAETIPEMIQPTSWKVKDAKLSYYAPSKVLVINNTPAVHAQVEEFLQGLRKTLPQKASAKTDDKVTQAQFALQDTSRPVSAVQTGPTSYPVPMAPVGPKHLFHFIIRYEGEGLIDSNVAKFTQALIQDKIASSSSNYVFPSPPPQSSADPLQPPPPPPAFGPPAPAADPAKGTPIPAAPEGLPAASAPTTDATLGGCAQIRVLLPDAAAKVTFNNKATATTGSNRLFVTPALTAGMPNIYTVRCTWMKDGQEVTREQAVSCAPNTVYTVDLTPSGYK